MRRIRPVAVYSNEDGFALHRFKADESYLIGVGQKPIPSKTVSVDLDETASLPPAKERKLTVACRVAATSLHRTEHASQERRLEPPPNGRGYEFCMSFPC